MLLALSLTSWALDDTAMYDSARAKVDAGDLIGAEALASELLQQYPSSPKAPGAQLMLARIAYKNTPDATGELLDAFSQVRTKYPTSPEAADALVHIGFLHSRSRTADAIRDFEEFANSYPNHPETARVNQSLGRLYLRTKELDKAEAAFDRLKSIPDASSSLKDEAALQSGFVKIMKYHASKKREHLTAAIGSLSAMSSAKSAKVRGRADLGIAESLLLLGKTTESRAKYQAAAQAYAADAYIKGIAMYGAACCSHMAGQYEAAASDYTAFIQAQAGSTLAEKNAAWKAAALKSTSAAMQSLVQTNGRWGRVQGSGIVLESAFHKARCLNRLGRNEEAVAVLTELTGCLTEGSELLKNAENLLAQCRSAAGGEQ